MSTFLLTAKMNIPLNSGMRIEKGQVFEVNLPFGHLPFDSIDSKSRVTKILELQGFDVCGHESILSGGFFDFKKL
ncbi:hypothetical protein [Marseilla massiliensis]|uniref:Uncharacterized protein n=1 Tax=Marseilla massiliensis TaxID=1841864 RepID=A0A939B7P4_9BACT|nr:hypothetical protein [Marseilla massiliensis]MBM6673870.1 hypothetical protein [Marseilla massiliensis]